MAKKRGCERQTPAEAKAKRQRLVEVRSTMPFASMTALAAIVTLASKETLPPAQRATITKGYNELVKTETPYGAIHQMVGFPTDGDGGLCIDLEIQHPQSMLWHAGRVSQTLSDLIKRSLAAKPCSYAEPWNAILYNDEISPGNQLAFKNSRKLQGIYWTLLEFGCTAHLQEESWFEVMIVRSVLCKGIYGGISGVIRTLVQTIFWGATHNLQRAGIHLDLHDGTAVHLFVRFGMLLADEAALHAIYGFAGASGLKSCPLCRNVYAVGNKRGIKERAGRVLHSCGDFSKVRLWTAEDLFKGLDALEREFGSRSKAAFEKLETAFGWKRHPGSCMADPAVREAMCPMQTLSFDWAHGIFVNGCFQKHAGLLLRFLHKKGPSFERLAEYCGRWKWPRRTSYQNGVKALTGSRAKASFKDKVLKTTASEGLGLLPVLAHFCLKGLCQHKNTRVRQHGRCLVLLWKIVRFILEANSPDHELKPYDLLLLVQEYMALFAVLYGITAMVPKFHWLLHYPGFLERWGSLPGCLALERKHRVPKSFADPINNTRNKMEVAVLRAVSARPRAEALRLVKNGG